MTPLRWAMHCDTHVEFFATKAEADAAAAQALQDCRNASKGPDGEWDGWDEFTAERIVVMRVIERATKVPGAHYSQDDWRMQPLLNDGKPGEVQCRGCERVFESQEVFERHRNHCPA